jgi:ubiquinone/menaquinone biosynthesis C-methylase UbiE
MAFKETFRVLKEGGELKAMIYHVPSWTGWQLWFLYSFLKGKPWKSEKEVVFEHLESPGTKVYSVEEAVEMLRKIGFARIEARPKLSPGDLLEIRFSEKYQGKIFKILQRIYPRWLVRFFGDRFGTFLLIRAVKPEGK